MNVLFICRANAGRSQMAEAFYNELSHAHTATSAGVDLAHSVMKSDLSVPPLVAEVMHEAGLDVSTAKRKAVTESMVQNADTVIIIMEEEEFPLPPYLLNSPKLTRWHSIPDAKNKDLAFHRVVRDQIKEKVEKMIG